MMESQQTLDGSTAGQQQNGNGQAQASVEVEQPNGGIDIQQLAGAIAQAANQMNSGPQQNGQNGQNVDSTDGLYHITDDLILTQDPDHYLLDNPTGDTYQGLHKYDDAPAERVPHDAAFISGELTGDVSTKEELLRALRSTTASPILIGDAGTAKNTSIDSVYHPIGQPVYRLQCGSGLTVFDLFAETDMRNGNTVTTLKPFGLATVFGGLAVADEINLANHGLIAHFNSMGEKVGSRKVTLPGTGVTLTDLPVSDEEIAEHGSEHAARLAKWDPDEHLGRYIHPEFRFAATRNPPTYSGADEINDALNDRFSPIRYVYVGIDTEARILAAQAGTAQGDVKPLVRVVKTEIREPRKHGNGVTCPISFRRLQDAVEYSLAHGVSLYAGAKEKIGGYAQNEMDRGKIEGALSDHKSDLSGVPTEQDVEDMADIGDEETVYMCSNCGWEKSATDVADDAPASANGVCHDCNGPFADKVKK